GRLLGAACASWLPPLLSGTGDGAIEGRGNSAGPPRDNRANVIGCPRNGFYLLSCPSASGIPEKMGDSSTCLPVLKSVLINSVQTGPSGSYASIELLVSRANSSTSSRLSRRRWVHNTRGLGPSAPGRREGSDELTYSTHTSELRIPRADIANRVKGSAWFG